MKLLWITKGSGGLESAFGLVAACLRWRVAPLLGAVFTEAVAGGFLASFALALPAGPPRAMVSAPAGRRARIGRGAIQVKRERTLVLSAAANRARKGTMP